MKLKTSFSKLPTFKKDISRFAPIWALYLIGMMLVLFEVGINSRYDRMARDAMPVLIQAFGIVNLIYAGVIALMLFGDLYNTRMCYSLHTQPARRETLLLNHLAAGVVFSVVPNIVATLFMMTQLEEYWFLALYWLLASTLEFVFFYGIATVSAMLVGNRFAMILVYLGLNFVSMLAYWIISTIYLPSLTGVMLDMDGFTQFCPTVELIRTYDFFQFKTIRIPNPDYPYGPETISFYQYEGLSTGWGYLAVLFGVGVVAMGIAMLLYRMRHLESAGDFVAFPKLKQVACVIMTICVTGVFALIGSEIIGDSMVLWIVVGLIIGFFGSLMLLERSLKVFRGKTFLGLALLAVVMFGSFAMIAFDVFGLVRWLPKPVNVESVTISNFRDDGQSGGYYDSRLRINVTDPEKIAEIVTAHRDIIQRLDEEYDPNQSLHRVTFTYKLKSGRTVKRTYSAPADGKNYEILLKFFNTPQNVLGYTDWESYVAGMEMISIQGWQIPEPLYGPMLEALKTDCEAGFVGMGLSNAVYFVELQTRENGIRVYRSLQIMAGAQNTLALMKKPEVILGYDDWDTFVKSPYRYVHATFDGVDYELEPEQQIALLEALKKDCEAGNVTLDDKYAPVRSWEIQISGDYGHRYIFVSKYAEHANAVLQELIKK